MRHKRAIGLTAVVAVAAGTFAAVQLGNANAATSAKAAASLSTSVAPGGNFNLSPWTLQLPTGSTNNPTQVPPSKLTGSNGFTNSSFYTDKSDGAMVFWAPEKGVHTEHSNFARSELRQDAEWSLTSNQKLSATLKVTKVTKSVCVGQIHLGSGGSSTKPLMELYYSKAGKIEVGENRSPTDGQDRTTITTVPVGTKFTYTIAVTGGKLVVTVNGTTKTFGIASSFKKYKQYFKAGSYNQSSSNSTTNGARVSFYALKIN
jgi:hypothetical protein